METYADPLSAANCTNRMMSRKKSRLQPKYIKTLCLFSGYYSTIFDQQKGNNGRRNTGRGGERVRESSRNGTFLSKKQVNLLEGLFYTRRTPVLLERHVKIWNTHFHCSWYFIYLTTLFQVLQTRPTKCLKVWIIGNGTFSCLIPDHDADSWTVVRSRRNSLRSLECYRPRLIKF